MFENEEFSLNRLRSAFVYPFCSWAGLVVNSNSFVANLIGYGLIIGAGWIFLFLLLFCIAWVLYTPSGLGFLVPF